MTEQLNELDDKSKVARSRRTLFTSSEESFYEEPVIFKSINDKVLSQHGGELLMHAIGYNKLKNKFDCKMKKSKYRPGMIVVGTKVDIFAKFKKRIYKKSKIN